MVSRVFFVVAWCSDWCMYSSFTSSWSVNIVWILVPKIMLFWFFIWRPPVKDNSAFIHNKKRALSSLKAQKFQNKVKVRHLERICVQDKGAILRFEPALILVFDV